MIMKTSKNSLITFSILTIVGIIGVLYALLILPRSNYQEGLVYGITSGFILTGILGIIYSIYLMRHPKLAKQVDLQKNEERTKFIRMQTATTAGQVILFAECIACLLVGLLGYKEISITLAIVLFFQFIISFGFAAYYSRKY
jgi:hypothetical protein